MTEGPVGRTSRRLGYLPRTVRTRWGARPGPAPVDDRVWAETLGTWVDLQADLLVRETTSDAAGRPVHSNDIVGRARRLWNLAHLHRTGWGGPGVAAALPAARSMVDAHADPDFGGYRWSIAAGRPNDQKLLYGQAVVIHALSELAMADPDAAPAALADAESVLALASDRMTDGGSIPEFLDHRWERIRPGTDTEMGTAGTVSIGGQLHLVEAMVGLLEAGGGDRARRVGWTAAEVLHDRFLPGAGYRDCSHTDEAGRPRPGPPSLGHEVEAAWILADGADLLGLDGEQVRARRWVEEAIDRGFRHGGLDDDPDPGPRPGGRQRIWWVQAELLRALVEFDDGPEGPMRRVMRRLLRWLHRHQVDPRTGQARQLMTHRGLVLATGDGTTTRTGYHDVRAYVAAIPALARVGPPGGP